MLVTVMLETDVFAEQGKIFPLHSKKTYKGSNSVGPLFLNLRTRWRWVVNFISSYMHPFLYI